jgi:hypothetical protein
MSFKSSPKAAEFGDFQTPSALATKVCRLLAHRGQAPASVVEPTCGIGNFLFAALEQFPAIQRGLGVEINQAYVDRLVVKLQSKGNVDNVRIIRENFFKADWTTLLRDLPEPILVIGNPPWVTNAQLGALGSVNLPAKSNFQNYSGLNAITGKSNFDISLASRSFRHSYSVMLGMLTLHHHEEQGETTKLIRESAYLVCFSTELSEETLQVVGGANVGV